MSNEHNADHPTAQETALGALLALDALYDGKPNGFRRQVETEDFGDVFEHALPEFRAAYTKAADAIDAAMPTDEWCPGPYRDLHKSDHVCEHGERYRHRIAPQTPPAPEEGERWEKAWTTEFVQGWRLYEIWAHRNGLNRRVASRVYEFDAYRIVADHELAERCRRGHGSK